MNKEQGNSRMQEDLMIFENIYNANCFMKSQGILLFTKIDKLEAKFLKILSIKYFEEYSGKGEDLQEVTACKEITIKTPPTNSLGCYDTP